MFRSLRSASQLVSRATATATASVSRAAIRTTSSASAASHSHKHHQQHQQQQQNKLAQLSNEELVAMIDAGKLPAHQLEKELANCTRAVEVRRSLVERNLSNEGMEKGVLGKLPHGVFNYDEFYASIDGTNCENVIGYVPVPVGVVGPLIIDNQPFRVPMATTEGALVASTNRGCRAIAQSGGATSVITNNGMTRAPLIRCNSVAECAAIKAWVDNPVNNKRLQDAFNSTTRFGRIRDITVRMAGRNVYVRFACKCGDAMGMNMVTKGAVAALAVIAENFPNAELVSLSGNVCSDKKAAAINWLEGRGRSVAVEVVIPAHVVEKTLKTSPDKLVEVNINKNLVGSAMAGSIGGFNAHASNIVAAVFLATGNDIAQNIESSNCITLVERHGDGVHVSVTMPSIEVGTVGGGTTLPAQRAALAMMGCAGANKELAGANADKLARAVAGAVLAGELSLISALASGHLLESHLRLNRKKDTIAVPASSPSSSSSSSSSGSSSSSSSSSSPMSHSTTAASAAAAGKRLFSTFGHPSSGGPAVEPVLLVEQPSVFGARASGLHASRVHNETSFANGQELYGESFDASFPIP